MDQAILDFVQFVNNYACRYGEDHHWSSVVVKLDEEIKSGFPPRRNYNTQQNKFHSIDLKKLIKDIHNYSDFLDWWQSRNMPKHLNKVLVKTILNLNPPESVKNALIFIML
jgi:hypothetical protein